MNVDEITKKFIEKQKRNGAEDNEIEETIFIAMSVAVKQTSQELEGKQLSESLQGVLKKLQDNPKEITNYLNSVLFTNEKVNESGETISDLFSRNYKTFLQDL